MQILGKLKQAPGKKRQFCDIVKYKRIIYYEHVDRMVFTRQVMVISLKGVIIRKDSFVERG